MAHFARGTHAISSHATNVVATKVPAPTSGTNGAISCHSTRYRAVCPLRDQCWGCFQVKAGWYCISIIPPTNTDYHGSLSVYIRRFALKLTIILDPVSEVKTIIMPPKAAISDSEFADLAQRRAHLRNCYQRWMDMLTNVPPSPSRHTCITFDIGGILIIRPTLAREMQPYALYLNQLGHFKPRMSCSLQSALVSADARHKAIGRPAMSKFGRIVM